MWAWAPVAQFPKVMRCVFPNSIRSRRVRIGDSAFTRHVDAVTQQPLFAGQQREQAEAQLGPGHVWRHYFAQFSTFSPGTRSNSRVLLLTRITPRAWAWAAIKVS